MAVASIAFPTPRAVPPSLTHDALVSLGGQAASLARPLAIAWFARIYGAAALGGFILIWTCVELGARVATLGLDRGVQRWTDERRTAAAAAGMVIAGITSAAMAAALCAVLPRFALIDDAALPAAQLLLLVALPLTAIGNVALRAARGSTQITTYVLARGVTEPALLLLAGLAVSSRLDGSRALPVALMISVAGGAVVATIGLAHGVGLRTLAASAVRVRAWPVRELVRTALPLGFADILQAAQTRLDLVAVAILTFSARAITSYAVAAEIASVFISIRFALDQVVAASAVEVRGNRAQLARLLTTAMRWSTTLAVPIGLAIALAPEQLLRWFGGSHQAVVVLLVLACGRAVEMIAAPAASMLAIVGAPKLSLLDAAAGVSIAVIGEVIAAVLGGRSVAIAAASAIGVIAASLLPLLWLSQLHGLAPWRADSRQLDTCRCAGSLSQPSDRTRVTPRWRGGC